MNSPLLSCSDIEELLAHFLPRHDVTKEEVILQLEQRHIPRQKKDITSKQLKN